MQNIINQFKSELRMNDYTGDRWAVAMGAFFQVAAHTYQQGETPHEWQFNTGIGGNYIDKTDSHYDFLVDLDYLELIAIGNYLHRLTNMLQLAGQSY